MMPMATFKQLIDIVLSRVGDDPTDPDIEALPVIKNAINQAYLILRTTVAPKTDTMETEYAREIPLSTKIGEIIDITHSSDGKLGLAEYRRLADILYIYSPLNNGTLTIRYIVLPSKLENDDDEVDLNPLYIPALIAYGAYAYQLYRRKYAAAQALLAEFQSYLPQPDTK